MQRIKQPALRLAQVLMFVALGVIATPEVNADHEDGHLQDWFKNGTAYSLQQALQSGYSVTVCSSEFPSSTSGAVSNWIAATGIYVFQNNCSPGNNVLVQSTGYPAYACDDPGPPYKPAHMCTLPYNVFGAPCYCIQNPTWVYVNPALGFVDGASHTTRDITHEFAHVLGHADYTGCPAGPTVVDTTEVGCP